MNEKNKLTNNSQNNYNEYINPDINYSNNNNYYTQNSYNNYNNNENNYAGYNNTNHPNTEYIYNQPSQHTNNNYNKNIDFKEDYQNNNNHKKNKFGRIIAGIIALIALLGIGIYFAYSMYSKNDEININMSQYEVEFSANGVDGEGKPSVDIIKTPNVEDSNSELQNLLQNPNISYNRNEHLRNGDKVEVTISLNKNQVNGKKIITKDEFKRSFTVKGLNKNGTEKETTVVKESNSNNSSNETSSKTNSRVKEDSSVDTTKLSEEQVKNWVLASYIQHLPGMTKDDYIVSVELKSDNLVYAGMSENPNSSKHPSPKMLPTRYRINSKGELEASSRMTEDWRVISKVYMYVE